MMTMTRTINKAPKHTEKLCEIPAWLQVVTKSIRPTETAQLAHGDCLNRSVQARKSSGPGNPR